jgi:O-antigen/teichoic acid export membrane protein
MAEENNRYSTLISDTAMISLGTVGSRLITFVMVRFYTEFMSPGDYGTADLITQIACLLIPVVSLGINDGVFRYSVRSGKSRRDVYSTGFLVLCAGIFMWIVIWPFLQNGRIFRGYAWAIMLYATASCFHTLNAQFIRAEGKVKLYSIQGIVNTVLTVSMNIIFLVFMHLGITGYVLSVILADAGLAVFLFIKEKLWRMLTLKPDRTLSRQMLKYSIPLIPTSILWWITSVSDRYMITYFIGSEANGIYAVAAKIPTILTILAGIFMDAWQISALREADGEKASYEVFYSKVWSAYRGLTAVMASVIILMSGLLVSLLAAEEYRSAERYVPLLVLAAVFSSYTSFFSSAYMVAEKSVLSFATAMAAATINIIMNLMLIPGPLGVQGAVIATAVSYFVVFIIRMSTAKKIINFRRHVVKTATSIGLILLQCVLASMDSPGPHKWENISEILQLLCFLIILWNERDILRQSYYQIKNFLIRKIKTIRPDM